MFIPQRDIKFHFIEEAQNNLYICKVFAVTNISETI